MVSTVVGATGFIGSHTAEQLKKAGHTVIALVRKSSDIGFLTRIGVTPRVCDFTDAEDIASCIDPGSTVYNCAAHSGSQNDAAGFQQTEIELTRRIIQSAVAAGARGYIQLSSIITYGHRLPSWPVNETFPPKPEVLMDKMALQREETVRETCRDGNLPFIILQPASTIGVRERMTAFGALKKMHREGKFPLVDGGKAVFSCIDTRDIGRAMAFLGENLGTLDGETFLLKGFDMSWMEYKTALDAEAGMKMPARNIPFGLLWIVAAIQERISKNPAMTLRAAYALGKPKLYDDGKIRAAGFSPIYSLKDAIEALRTT